MRCASAAASWSFLAWRSALIFSNAARVDVVFDWAALVSPDSDAVRARGSFGAAQAFRGPALSFFLRPPCSCSSAAETFLRA